MANVVKIHFSLHKKFNNKFNVSAHNIFCVIYPNIRRKKSNKINWFERYEKCLNLIKLKMHTRQQTVTANDVIHKIGNLLRLFHAILL